MSYQSEQLGQQNLTLELEEWRSLDRQIKSLTERKKLLEDSISSQFSTKDGQLSTVHSVDGFKITKKEAFKYTLNKKAFSGLTIEQQSEILALGAVQHDFKMSEAKVRELAQEKGELLSKCFTSKLENTVKIEFKGE